MNIKDIFHNLHQKAKQLYHNNPLILLAIPSTLFLLFAIKRYTSGGVCRAHRDLNKKVVVLTGGNTGIGKATIEQLANNGCKIIFGARDDRKSQEALKDIKKKNLNADIVYFNLNLGSKQKIEEFSKNILRQVPKVDILINNAAVFLVPQRTLTVQGFQMHMGVNHLGHFYLTHLLWPIIKKAQKPRIINVSALAHRGFQPPHKSNIPIDFNNLHLNNNYTPSLGYSCSKVANILFTKQLQKRMDQSKFEGYSYSLHPGIVRTEIARQVGWMKYSNYIIYPLYYLFTKSELQGAQTTLYTVLEDENKLEKGGYYSDCKPSFTSDFASNLENARRLWEISERELNIKFEVK